MEIRELNESRRLQLNMLQTRINEHGRRMWQLPLTYFGLILLALGNLPEKSSSFSPALIFLILTITGAVLFWGILGAKNRYKKTGLDMNEIEKNLGLKETTKTEKSHYRPYLLLMLIEIIFSAFTSIYYY